MTFYHFLLTYFILFFSHVWWHGNTSQFTIPICFICLSLSAHQQGTLGMYSHALFSKGKKKNDKIKGSKYNKVVKQQLALAPSADCLPNQQLINIFLFTKSHLKNFFLNLWLIYVKEIITNTIPPKFIH